MIFLSIDTSCDETSVAVTSGKKILSNVVSSQVRYHKKFGGVVPFLAQRLHEKRIDSIVDMAINRSGLSWSDIAGIAVTQGPGLAPALQVGTAKAKELAAVRSLPLYAVNHMAGHIASCFVESPSHKAEIAYPALCFLVSGGHTEMVLMEEFGKFSVIGETLDDAIGEAYDKVAKMLGLGYPGGKLVAQFADKGDAARYELPIPMKQNAGYDFSFSGLKNAVRLLIYEIKDGTHQHVMEAQEMYDVCAAFQNVSQASLLQKLRKALKHHPRIRSVLLAGGVAANTVLRGKIRKEIKSLGVSFYAPPSLKLCGDNAAMIGVAAYLGVLAGQKPVNPAELDRVPGLRLEGSSDT